eukprot:3174998-Rhodomonas_salina.1
MSAAYSRWSATRKSQFAGICAADGLSPPNFALLPWPVAILRESNAPAGEWVSDVLIAEHSSFTVTGGLADKTERGREQGSSRSEGESEQVRD